MHALSLPHKHTVINITLFLMLTTSWLVTLALALASYHYFVVLISNGDYFVEKITIILKMTMINTALHGPPYAAGPQKAFPLFNPPLWKALYCM